MSRRRIEIDTYTVNADGHTFWEWSCDECGQFEIGLPTEDDARNAADTHDCDED